ncbi:acetyl-CoA carboxylase carboxyltransferase subunit alpha [Ferrovibrio xuzhouensis]|uniref:Acetyl-coenzyme A carboxylase carboxyl transferase subunit alpha n=1 Tax=Ferrovibrio xuzhouensis TaxID=1576914 RepID=A0ABV7VEF5_9PROT
MHAYLEFEKPIAELEAKIAELKQLAADGSTDITDELERLEAKAEQQLRQTYAKLGAWQKTQVARHQDRPHFADYVAALIEDYTPLAGDRAYAEDAAIVGGLGRFRGRAVMVMGHEKGRGIDGRVKHNFGMAKPEGYRKAIRLMRLAERFRLPVVTLVDTAGAYPGVQAEERGQAEAIARAIDCCLDLRVPLVSAIVGEGGSGGAVALAAANRVVMFEHAVYSVISPEGCAAILWGDGGRGPDAAAALRITAEDLVKLKVVDEVVKEPLGGAHRDPKTAMADLGDVLDRHLRDLAGQEPGSLRESRRRKFIEMGSVGL